MCARKQRGHAIWPAQRSIGTLLIAGNADDSDAYEERYAWWVRSSSAGQGVGGNLTAPAAKTASLLS